MGGRSLKRSGWRAALNTVAVVLLTQGASLIQQGDYIAGGVMVVAGFAIFLVSHYFGCGNGGTCDERREEA
jgi:uncharacterized membrane protein YjjP (DUF1212 family)